MNTQKFLLSSLIGGIAYFLLGWLIYGMAMASFFASHTTAAGAMKEMPDMVFLALGNLAFGALLSYIFVKWAGISTPASGAQAGAVIGLLMATAIDFMLYGTTTMMDITGTIVDIIVMTVMSAIAGAVIGWFLGRK